MKRSSKYVGLDVRQATTVTSVREETRRVLARRIPPPDAAAIVESGRRRRGPILATPPTSETISDKDPRNVDDAAIVIRPT